MTSPPSASSWSAERGLVGSDPGRVEQAIRGAPADRAQTHDRDRRCAHGAPRCAGSPGRAGPPDRAARLERVEHDPAPRLEVLGAGRDLGR